MTCLRDGKDSYFISEAAQAHHQHVEKLLPTRTCHQAQLLTHLPALAPGTEF